MNDVKIKQGFMIPTGTELTKAPNKITLYEPHYECYLSAGDDNTIRLLVPESVIEDDNLNIIFEEGKNEDS